MKQEQGRSGGKDTVGNGKRQGKAVAEMGVGDGSGGVGMAGERMNESSIRNENEEWRCK